MDDMRGEREWITLNKKCVMWYERKRKKKETNEGENDELDSSYRVTIFSSPSRICSSRASVWSPAHFVDPLSLTVFEVTEGTNYPSLLILCKFMTRREEKDTRAIHSPHSPHSWTADGDVVKIGDAAVTANAFFAKMLPTEWFNCECSRIQVTHLNG